MRKDGIQRQIAMASEAAYSWPKYKREEAKAIMEHCGSGATPEQIQGYLDHGRVGVKYVVMSRLSPEAIAELMPCAKVLPEGFVQFGTHPLSLDEAIKEMQARQIKPLLTLDDQDDVQEIGMMYSEVWIEDEEGNKVTV